MSTKSVNDFNFVKKIQMCFENQGFVQFSSVTRRLNIVHYTNTAHTTILGSLQ